MQGHVPHDPTRPEPVAPHLELRLDQDDEIRRRPGTRPQGGQHQPQGDERQIGHHQVDRPTDLVGGEIADVGAFQHHDPWIGPQLPRQLAVADVHRDDLTGVVAQQHVGETTGGRPGVQTPASAHPQRWLAPGEGRQCRQQFVGAARRVPGVVPGNDRNGGGVIHDRRGLGRRTSADPDPSAGDRFAGLLAGSEPCLAERVHGPAASCGPRQRASCRSRPRPAGRVGRPRRGDRTWRGDRNRWGGREPVKIREHTVKEAVDLLEDGDVR